MAEHCITVMPSGHEFHAVEQETLLEAALRSGLNIDLVVPAAAAATAMPA